MFTQRAGKLYPVVQPYCYHCGSPLADTETEYCQNCRKHRSFVAEGRSLLYIVGLCRNPCTGLSMQTGGDMPVFWRRKPCSAGKTGCGKKDRSHRSGTDVFEKERYRGYNQAALLAGHCQKMDIPCIPRLMIRVKDTRPQKELNGRERENNVKMLFRVRIM